MTPRSRGTVKLASADPDAAPRIRLNMLEDPRDVARMSRGCARPGGIGAQSPSRDLASGPEQWAGAGLEDDEQLAEGGQVGGLDLPPRGPEPARWARIRRRARWWTRRGAVYGVDGLTVRGRVHHGR